MRIYRLRRFPAKLFILILILIVIALNPKLSATVKGFGFEILAKPFEIASSIKRYFGNFQRLSKENLLLKQRIASLSVDLARLKEIEVENERLRSLLKFTKNVRYEAVIAEVVSRDATDWRSAITINKGRKDGIRERMPCATAKGLVGRVVEAGENSSKIILITDPNSRVGVILEPSRESGVLIGSQEGVCRVIYLSIDGGMKVGEKVVTAGYGPIFPKGLEVGTVSMLGVQEGGLYKYAAVNPFEDLHKIEEVVCLVREGER